jgi:hypothetical protein
MANVTVDEVKNIIDTTLDTADIEAYISTATAVLDNAYTGYTVSTALRKEVERWLTAHLIASTREQQLTEAKAGSASAKFQGKTGMNLYSTFYGQNAISIDTTGALAGLGGKTINITSLEED